MVNKGDVSDANAEFMNNYFGTSILADTNKENNPSPVGRMVNCFINKFNETKRLPKWVVLLLEDDLIESIAYKQYGTSEMYGHILDYMMTAFSKATKKVNDALPLRSTKFCYPHFLWMEPTLHTNHQNITLRTKFIRSLHVVAQMHDEMISLPVRHPWNQNDTNLYNWLQQSLSANGYATLWKALDATINFVDTKLMRNHGLYLKNIFQKSKLLDDANKRASFWDEKIRIRRQKRIQHKTQQEDLRRRTNNVPNRPQTGGTNSDDNSRDHSRFTKIRKELFKMNKKF